MFSAVSLFFRVLSQRGGGEEREGEGGEQHLNFGYINIGKGTRNQIPVVWREGGGGRKALWQLAVNHHFGGLASRGVTRE